MGKIAQEYIEKQREEESFDVTIFQVRKGKNAGKNNFTQAMKWEENKSTWYHGSRVTVD